MSSTYASGAEYLASIYGTEKDKVNCSFYFKIGACRHGDKCSRIHNIPTFSQTVLLRNLYHDPNLDMRKADVYAKVGNMTISEQQEFDEFYAEIFEECEEKYGKIEEMNICDNIGEHMIGNVYIKFFREDDAEKCVTALRDRWFNGEPIYPELSPVTDCREGCCRQDELGGCNKGAFCNFMHLKQISSELSRRLYGSRSSPIRSRGIHNSGGGGGNRGYENRGNNRNEYRRDNGRNDRGFDRRDNRDRDRRNRY